MYNRAVQTFAFEVLLGAATVVPGLAENEAHYAETGEEEDGKPLDGCETPAFAGHSRLSFISTLFATGHKFIGISDLVVI